MYRKLFLYAFVFAVAFWLFSPIHASASYTLSVANQGSGTITGTGINCGRDCREDYASGTLVTLSASPAGGYRFVTWSRDCKNRTGNCVVVMDGNKNVTANFYQLSLDQGGSATIITTGGGAIISTGIPGGTGIEAGSGASITTGDGADITRGTGPGTGGAIGGTGPRIVLGLPVAPVTPGLPPPTPPVTPPAPTSTPPLVPCDNSPSKPCDFNAFMDLINKVIRFILFSLAIPIAAVMFAYAGFLMVTSGGSTEAKGRAKNIFSNAVYGLVIAATAWLIVRTILSILGYDGAWIGFPFIV